MRRKKKRHWEENEVIELSQKPQSQASKRGREGGGRVYVLYLFQCSIRFFFFTAESQLFPHMLVWFECRGVKRKKWVKESGRKEKQVLCLLYFIFHSAFQICRPPALQKTCGSSTQRVFGLFLYFKMFILLCWCPVFAEWFYSPAHCLQEKQSQGDGATSEAWSVHTGSHWG